MIECEKKIMLTDKEYNIILALFADTQKTHFQRNYYYDTDDLKFNKQGITCRIREKDGEYVATVKQHNWGSEYCSIERIRTVSKEFNGNIFSDMNVKLQGCLETLRTVIYVDDDIEIVLDKSDYLGTEDYELEIEYKKNKEDYAEFKLRYLAYRLRDIDKNFDVVRFCHYKPTKSKSERFFEMLKKIK